MELKKGECVRGHGVNSKGVTWVVEELLGEGGFGAVFAVHSTDEPTKRLAMKTERKNPNREHRKLTMEVMVLSELKREHQSARHFSVLHDSGHHLDVFFLVMDLLGPSLHNLRKKQPNKVFSIGTALEVSRQMLSALQLLHLSGFLHRDLKPDNLAIGVGDKRRTIVLIDFGLARKHFNSAGRIKYPREACNPKGTRKYASVNCLRGIDQGCNDDLEGWMYCLWEFILPDGLPWKYCVENDQILNVKEKCRSGIDREQLFVRVPSIAKDLERILSYIVSLHYYTPPDYEYLHRALDRAFKRAKCVKDERFDWEKFL